MVHSGHWRQGKASYSQPLLLIWYLYEYVRVGMVDAGRGTEYCSPTPSSQPIPIMLPLPYEYEYSHTEPYPTLYE